MYFILSLILLIITSGIFEDFSIVINGTIFIVLGYGLVSLCKNKKNLSVYMKIYGVCFFFYLLYAVICYIYKQINGFETMFVSDNITAFIPLSEKLARLDFAQMWETIYMKNDATLIYQHCGWILIVFAYIIRLTNWIGTEVYFNLQVSIIFFASFIPVFVYKLLRQNAIKQQNALRWTMFYAFCSILFYYSSLILRDIPIALAYVISFCYIGNRLSIKNIVIFILAFILTLGLRPQAAIFLLLVPFISVFNLKGSVNKTLILIGAVVVIIPLIAKFNGIEQMEETNTIYQGILQDRQGASTLNSLNSLPPVISTIAKIVFILLSPIPSWAFMAFGADSTGLNNMLGFPRALGAFFDYIILGYILWGIWNRKKINIPLNIWYMFFLGLVFIAVQSNSIELRRIMPCFPLLSLFAAYVYDKLPRNDRKQVFYTSTLVFTCFQILGMTKYL